MSQYSEDPKPKTTETFKVLVGAADDKGVKYEYLMTVLCSLELAFDKGFKDFKISCNNEAFGNFDDVVLELTTENDVNRIIAIQLKHGKNDGQFTDGKLASDKKSDFGFRTYYKSFQDFYQEETHRNLNVILYTNKEFTTKLKENQGEIELQFSDKSSNDQAKYKYTVKIVKWDQCVFDNILNTSVKVSDFIYKLKIEDAPPDKKNALTLSREEYLKYAIFFEKFFIYAGQLSADEIEKLISSKVREKFKFDGFQKYNQYIKEWYDGDDKEKEKLHKEAIEDKITETILEPYLRLPNAGNCELNDKTRLIQNAILSFRITILCKSDYITDIWNQNQDIPVILELDETHKETVFNIIRLDSTKGRCFVLMGIDSGEAGSFQCLADLEKVNFDLFNEILNTFSCDFQGRSNCTLREIAKPEILKAIRVEHLMKMAFEQFAIGDKAKDIPNPPYIPRRIPKIMINSKSLQKPRNNVFVINCERENAFLTHHRKANPGKVIVFEGNCPKEHFKKICSRYRDKNIHCLQLVGEDRLEWISTTARNNENFPELEQNEESFVKDTDVLNHFKNNINVLIADSGVGKSTMFDFLKLNSSTEFWPVKIDLMMHHKKFENLNLLDHSDDITKTVQSLYEKNKKVLYLLDGIDVLQSEQIEMVLAGIKKLSQKECPIWIAAKSHLKDRLENEFGVFALTLARADQNDQKHYIGQRLESKFSAQEIGDIEKIVISNKDFQDMFGMPLTLFMFTDVWLKNQKRNSKPTAITHLYREFIDAKFDFYRTKANVETGTLIDDDMDLLKALVETHYVQAALKTCFDIDTQDRAYIILLEKIKSGGDKFGFITSVNEDEVPIFSHQTYAEFLCASFLIDHLNRHDILNQIFETKHENLRYMFDLLLADNSPGHLAVIQRNLDKLIVDDSLDKGGRNVLQVACSWGKRHPLLNTRNDGERCISFKNTHHEFTIMKNEDSTYIQMIKNLMEHNGDVFQKDQLFQWNALEYADQSLSLAAIEVIAGFKQINLKELNNFQDINSVLSYAIKFGYVNIWKMIDPKPFFHFEPYCINNSLTLLVECNRREFFESVIDAEYSTLINGCYKQRSLLALALHNDCFDIANLLIDKGVDINANYHNDYPILVSVKKGNVDIAKRLLAEPKIDINVKDKAGRNIVHLAARRGLLEILQILQRGNLWSKLEINSVETLHFAIKSGSLNVLEFLAENGLELTHLDEYGANALHYAVRHAPVDCNFKILKYLINTGKFELDAADTKGSLTALHTAVVKNNVEILEFLISQGCDTQKLAKNNRNLLELAFLQKNYDMAEYLISSKIGYINNGFVEKALAERRLESIEILLKHKVCIDIQTVAFQIAESPWSSDSVKALTYLLNYGKDICKIRDGSGNTLLHHYIKNGSLENCSLLVKNGSDINAINNNQENMLHSSTDSNLLKMTEFVLENGLADKINAIDGKGHSALHRAVKKGNLEMVRLLLRHSANVHALCANERTVLHLAARKYHFEVLTFLLSVTKFPPNIKDARGNTVLYYAISGGDLSMTKHLIEIGYRTDGDVANDINLTLLHAAAYGPCLDTVKYLVEILGFDANKVDDLGRKPIDLCIDMEIAKYLFERTGGSGVKLLHNAVQSLYHVIVQFLVKHVDVNEVDELGNSALHYVALHKNYKKLNASKNVVYKTKFRIIVLALLQAGADFRLKNGNDETPLSIAESRGEEKLIKIFLDQGAASRAQV